MAHSSQRRGKVKRYHLTSTEGNAEYLLCQNLGACGKFRKHKPQKIIFYFSEAFSKNRRALWQYKLYNSAELYEID